MKKLNAVPVAIALIYSTIPLYSTQTYAGQPRDPAVCKLPTKIPDGNNSYQHLAWQIFVAANCDSGKTDLPLTWETWPEQDCLKSGKKDCTNNANQKRLHASILATRNFDFKKTCQPMTTKDNAPSSAFLPFVPKNLTENPEFCEEVHVNQDAADFITSPSGKSVKYSLQTLSGQKDYVANNGKINFPRTAIEIKVDWLPASSIKEKLNCDIDSKEYYLEKIDGVCYAMVSFHLNSKLTNNWVWATFEPQSAITNPNRCKSDLYSNCNDPWGSSPPISNGQVTSRTADLDTLIDKANLSIAFKNYRLVGVQTNYTSGIDTPIQKPVLLGNSFTEFNAGVTPKKASCMTCHAYASFTSDTKPIVQNPYFGAFPGTPPIGRPAPLTNWTKQDFSWLLGVMPPNNFVSAGKE